MISSHVLKWVIICPLDLAKKPILIILYNMLFIFCTGGYIGLNTLQRRKSTSLHSRCQRRRVPRIYDILLKTPYYTKLNFKLKNNYQTLLLNTIFKTLLNTPVSTRYSHRWKYCITYTVDEQSWLYIFAFEIYLPMYWNGFLYVHLT